MYPCSTGLPVYRLEYNHAWYQLILRHAMDSLKCSNAITIRVSKLYHKKTHVYSDSIHHIPALRTFDNLITLEIRL